LIVLNFISSAILITQFSTHQSAIARSKTILRLYSLLRSLRALANVVHQVAASYNL